MKFLIVTRGRRALHAVCTTRKLKHLKAVTCFRLASFRACTNWSAREAIPLAHRRIMSSFSALASPSCTHKKHKRNFEVGNFVEREGSKRVEYALARTAPVHDRFSLGEASKGWHFRYALEKDGESVVETCTSSLRHRTGCWAKPCLCRTRERVWPLSPTKTRRKTEIK